MDCRVLLGLLIHEGEVFRGGTQTPGNSNDFFRWCCVFVLSLILWKKGTCIFADWKILQAACTLFGSHRYDIQALAPTPLQPSLYSMHCLFSNLKDSEKVASAMDREHSLEPNPGRQWSPTVTATVSHWVALWVHAGEGGGAFVFRSKRPFKFDR